MKDLYLDPTWPSKRMRKLMARFAESRPVTLAKGERVDKNDPKIEYLTGYSIGLPGEIHDFVLWFCEHHLPTTWLVPHRQIDQGYMMPCYFCPNEKMDA